MPETGPDAVESAPAPQPDAVAPAVEVAVAAEEPLDVPLPNERLLGARDLALAALHEITPPATVGPPAGYLPEADGVISLRFENRLGGYPGWYWTVSVAQVGDEEPTVLEAELLPGEGALLAPEWVPWAERLAEYRAHQAELAATAQHDPSDGESEDADELEEDADVDDVDADDLEDDELEDDEETARPRLHAGDLDGVDIDELDDSASREGDAADEQHGDEDDDDADDEGDEDDEDDEDDAAEEE
ncbi:DUF3027 domain-containing protein [Microbacterium xylanilyticum]